MNLQKGHKIPKTFSHSKQNRLYRIDLGYIGSQFEGFQSQPSKNTVQDHLEKALEICLKQKVRIKGASRTDSGVHAHHQVATFRTDKSFSPKWLFALNALTPPDIGIFKLQPAAEDFNPITNSKAKVYRYRIWQGKCFNPFVLPFIWQVNHRFDLEKLQKEANHFIGTHDFQAFCNQDSQVKTTQRKILSVYCEQRGPMINIWITGEGFLKQMVRIMVGTLVAISKGHYEEGSIKKLLTPGTKRSFAGMTAPAKGLSLVKIFYNDIIPLDKVIQNSDKGFTFPIYDECDYILSGGQYKLI